LKIKKESGTTIRIT